MMGKRNYGGVGGVLGSRVWGVKGFRMFLSQHCVIGPVETIRGSCISYSKGN